MIGLRCHYQNTPVAQCICLRCCLGYACGSFPLVGDLITTQSWQALPAWTSTLYGSPFLLVGTAFGDLSKSQLPIRVICGQTTVQITLMCWAIMHMSEYSSACFAYCQEVCIQIVVVLVDSTSFCPVPCQRKVVCVHNCVLSVITETDFISWLDYLVLLLSAILTVYICKYIDWIFRRRALCGVRNLLVFDDLVQKQKQNNG